MEVVAAPGARAAQLKDSSQDSWKKNFDLTVTNDPRFIKASEIHVCTDFTEGTCTKLVCVEGELAEIAELEE